VVQGVAVPGESFDAELFATTGYVAACETEPEIALEGALGALREAEGGFLGGEGV
jgi:hypothetical protein